MSTLGAVSGIWQIPRFVTGDVLLSNNCQTGSQLSNQWILLWLGFMYVADLREVAFFFGF